MSLPSRSFHWSHPMTLNINGYAQAGVWHFVGISARHYPQQMSKTQCKGDIHSSKTAIIILPGLMTEYRWTPLRVPNCIPVQMHPWMLVETTRVTEFEYYFACKFFSLRNCTVKEVWSSENTHIQTRFGNGDRKVDEGVRIADRTQRLATCWDWRKIVDCSTGVLGEWHGLAWLWISDSNKTRHLIIELSSNVSKKRSQLGAQGIGTSTQQTWILSFQCSDTMFASLWALFHLCLHCYNV